MTPKVLSDCIRGDLGYAGAGFAITLDGLD